MAQIEVTIPGTDVLAERLARFGTHWQDVAARALFEEAEILLAEVQRRTPVDTGALRASEFVAPPVTQGGEISVTLAAGGPSAPYAIYVHENLEAHHPVGQAKFLESVVLESAPHMARRLADRIDLLRAL